MVYSAFVMLKQVALKATLISTPSALQPMPQSGFAISVPEAVGVVGVLLPDNNPLYSLVTLMGAAVATGNAVIIVPSQTYPLPALMFIQVNIISGIIDIINVKVEASSILLVFVSLFF